jgi:hypothetical protein
MYKIYKITSNSTVDFAAEELKKYLRMMMLESGEITIEYKPDAKEGFRLGIMADFNIDTSEALDIDLDDIIHIDTTLEGGIIAGSNYRSVLLAVYRFLTLNGCRWLYPGIDGEYIPIQDIKPTKYHKMADNRYRGWCNEGAEFQPNMMEAIDFAPKVGLNIFMLEFFNPIVYYNSYYNHNFNRENREPEPIPHIQGKQWKRQCEAEIAKRDLEFHDIGHAWATVPFGIDPDKTIDYSDGKDHSEIENAHKYLAEVNGKRRLSAVWSPNKNVGVPMWTNFCMSNPEARKIVVDSIVDYCKKNPHVDYLHFWLGDSMNETCECEECRKKAHSDWYVILLNEIDAELTRLNIKNRIVYIAYYDSIFPPETEVIKNPNRFSMLLAPITRSYSCSVPAVNPEFKLKPYVKNKNAHPSNPAEPIAYGKEWERRCKTDSLLYEYHFWYNRFMEITGLGYGELIYNDVKNYKAQGFKGIIEDGSQRCFFPNGFAFYSYASTLFDSTLSFEEIRDDYFKHAYGEDWEKIKDFFYKMMELIEHNYMCGNESANSKFGKYYNPSKAEKLRKVSGLIDEIKPLVRERRKAGLPMRAQTVSFRLLDDFLFFAQKIADCMILKCFGASREAKALYNDFRIEFGKREVEIERYFDITDFAFAMENRIMKADDEELRFDIHTEK